MKLTGVYLSDNLSYSGRLLKGDIMRLPSTQTNRADFYMPVQPSPSRKNNVFLRNLFTALTFGFTGLYIAHRNDLFNPIRREAKRIIKSDDFINKIRTFVDGALNPQSYKDAARRSLEILSENKSRGEEFMNEAKKILASDKDFSVILTEVSKKFAADLMTRAYLNRKGTGSGYFPADNYVIVDLAVNYKPIKELKAYIKVNNLFDKFYAEHSAVSSYMPPGSWYTMPGRSIVAGIEYSF